jgi:hypothetical protein
VLAAELHGLRRLLRVEDILLAIWLVFVVPLLAATAEGMSLFAGSRAAAGAGGLGPLLALLSSFGAFVCLVTRSRGEPGRTEGGLTPPMYAPLPMMAAIGIVSTGAATQLGWDNPRILFMPVVVGTVAALLLPDRLPTIEAATRRALVVPFVLVGVTICQATMADLWQDIRPGDFAAGFSQEALVLVLFVLGVLGLLSLVAYGVFVFAPRQIAEPEGSWRAWATRFAVYMFSIVLGIGWLRLFA